MANDIIDSFGNQINVVVSTNKGQRESERKEQEKIVNDFSDVFKGFSDTIKKNFTGDSQEKTWKKIGEDFGNKISSVFDDVGDRLVDLFKDAWAELDNILNYSRLSNARTRELAFTYGFTGSQAYGYDQAMKMLGFNNIEDLMYATPEQSQKFQEAMTKYTEKYSQLYDSGFFDEYENFQIEMKEFQQDMKLEIVDFFMDNKDLIKSGFKALMSIAQFVLDILNFLGVNNSMSESERIAKTNDIINQSAVSNYKNSNVKIDNTFNNVAQNDQSWLVNAGQMTYEQVIQALT